MNATAITPELIPGTEANAIDLPSIPADPAGVESEAPPSPEIQVSLPSGEVRTYLQAAGLLEDLVEGQIPKESRARVVADPAETETGNSGWVSVAELAVHHPELRSAYRPIWNTALQFMGYGALAGVALKLLETTATMFMIDGALGFVWLVVVGSIAVSSRWALAPFFAIYLSFKVGFAVNLFVTALAAGLIGIAFGGPLGLVIGTLVGHLRKDRAETAPDAQPEGARTYLLGLALPAIYLCVAIPAYVWLNIKAFAWLAG